MKSRKINSVSHKLLRRNIYFYIQRGLLAPPNGRGRGATYTREHVQQLQRLLYMKRAGVQLDTIRELPLGAEIEPQHKPPRTGVPQVCIRVRLLEGVRLELDSDQYMPTRKVFAELAETCARILRSARRRGEWGI